MLNPADKNEIIGLIENHIEKVFLEIWAPIESKIRAQIHDVDKTLNNIDNKLSSFEKKSAKLRKEFRGVVGVCEATKEDTTKGIELIKNECSRIKRNTLDDVKDSVKLAIELGTKALELQAPHDEKIKSFQNEVDEIQIAAKALIKKECDLRIIEILNLKKNYESLLDLTNKTLRKYELYKNIEEPSRIIL